MTRSATLSATTAVANRSPGRARRWIAVLIAVAFGASLPSFAAAQSETDAERAAREIREARERARAAAEAFFQAESDLDVLAIELDGLEAQELQLQLRVDELRREVERVALGRFVSSGAEGIPLLTDVTEPRDRVQVEVYTGVLTNTGADTLDQFDAAEKSLLATQDEIADARAEIEDRQVVFLALEEQANAEVERLREIEEERLQDEAVQRALEAQLAAERAALEEEARLAAEAEARARPNPGLTTTTTIEPPPTTEPPVESAGGEGDAAASAPGTPNGDETDVATTSTTTTLPSSVTTLPPNTGESGGTSGGRTGASGGGSNPSGINTGAGYIDNIICPINGSAYADTWGAPRSGGRKHQGVDMIAPSGVPLFAVVSGVVTFKQNRLGGNAVSLVGDNGNRYYYAHLSAYEGPSGRRVNQGDVIGYNGSTGNSSTPHLHLQIHPGGGQPVNPYPSVRVACG